MHLMDIYREITPTVSLSDLYVSVLGLLVSCLMPNDVGKTSILLAPIRQVLSMHGPLTALLIPLLV